MKQAVSFTPYQPKTILNKHKRPDHWFWTRYSAHPYLGCQHGCKFCYCRELKYSPYDDAADFDQNIRIKTNATDLFRRALSRVPIDLVFTGDYQPAERKFQLSRRLLEVCHDLGFPVFILERSPLVTRDLDLVSEINQKAPCVVAFSIIHTPQSRFGARISEIENFSPPPEKRFAAMRAFAQAGILTGTCFMPILPGLCDDDANLESVIRWTVDHGGKFVLPSSLTLADQQKDFFLNFLIQRMPEFALEYQKIYPPGSYAPRLYSWNKKALRIRELCENYGISDRIPRPIIPGDKRALNKLIAEKLANDSYTCEINDEPSHRIWAFRKAAWAMEDLPQDIALIYKHMGLMGLQGIQQIGPNMADIILKMLKDIKVVQNERD